MNAIYVNPFRPGAGHRPPYLAGRETEKAEFQKLLNQDIITDNAIVTGLRGVGKTVLLDSLKEIAFGNHWWWVGTNMSESATLTEQNISTRLMADLSVATSQLVLKGKEHHAGLRPIASTTRTPLHFETLSGVYGATPGLEADKLKAVLEFVWRCLPEKKVRGIIFAYDEAQVLSDHAADKQFPLSLVLEVFQYLQPRGIRFMLVLAGLPTLFPKLVEARTSAERMFHLLTLERLSDADSREAIARPIQDAGCPPLPESLVKRIIKASGGYPYFIQFICREAYDIVLSNVGNKSQSDVSIESITLKLDADFFSGRWTRATDRQRDLLRVIAAVGDDEAEFSVQDIVTQAEVMAQSGQIESGFGSSHVNQMLAKLAAAGFVYKNRHGRYLFAVPLLGQYIRRQG